MPRKYFFLASLLLIMATYSCTKDRNKPPVVKPPDTLYVDMTGISDINQLGSTLHGRKSVSSSQQILAHGFVWSDSVKLPTLNDFVKSFATNTDSLFSYRVTNDLEPQKRYYVRAFLTTASSTLYSDTMSFLSLGCTPPSISGFYPDSACGGRIVTITGSNFSVKRHRDTVRFGTLYGTVLKATIDTLQVRTPNTPETKDVNIFVTVAGQTGVSQNTFRLICPWSPLQQFPGEARYWNTSFTIGSKGYICLGKADMNSFASTQLWAYDHLTNSWQERQHFPVEQRYYPVGFAIDGKGYAGLGEDDSFYMFKDMYRYDPVTDTWTQVQSFPGTLVHSLDPPSWFVLNNRLYIYLPGNHTFWEYDPAADHWTQMPANNMLTGKWVRQGFTYDNKGFFLQYDQAGFMSCFKLYEYNPSQNTISLYDSVTTTMYWINQGAFLIGDKLYLPLRMNHLMEYDFVTKAVWDHDSPTDQEDFNIGFIFGEKAVLGITSSKEILQFYPR